MKNKILLSIGILLFFVSTNVYANTNDSMTKSWIDYPKSNENIGNNLKIQGWVLSKVSNTEVEVYLDSTKIEVPRVKRDDVLNNIKDFGTIKENPTPGYYRVINISNLSYGNHMITINVLKGGRKILTDKAVFNHMPPKTLINIDYPALNKEYNRSNKLKIQGWVMSEESNPTVEFYIDGVKRNEELDRLVREDVIRIIKGYGTIKENPTPGIYKLIDVSNLNYGRHTLKIVAKDKEGRVLKEESRVFNLKTPKTLINIDYPALNKEYSLSNKLKIQGWVMSEESNPTVEFYIDGVKRNEELDRLVREDVIRIIKGYGTIKENPTPGIYKLIDVSNLNYGKHTLKIVAKDNEGRVLKEESRVFNLKTPKTLINIDYPSTKTTYLRNEKLKVQGWVMSESQSASAEAYIDGVKVPETLDRLVREDVIRIIKGYGTIKENPTPGIYKLIDISKLSYGKHTLKITAKDKNGKILKETSTAFEIRKPKTKIFIQKPTNNGTVGLNSNIDGWVMSEEPDVYVKIFVDNKQVSNNIKREIRSDVIKAISGYGTIKENPTPGYTTSYNFDGLKDGKHTIMAKAYAKNTNVELASTSLSVNLKKYKTLMNIDYPAITALNNNENMVIQGWAVSTAKANTIKVYMDNTELTGVTKVARSDVLKVYPEYNLSSNNNPGYYTSISLNKYSEGKHTITIKLFDELNEVIDTQTRGIQLYKNVYQGIDVSEHNGKINWQSVKKSGINFAMIRIGYRGYGDAGNKREDIYFRTNLSEAKQNGLKVGIYFFSQAKNYAEGKDEAQYVINILNDMKKKGYNVSLQYPISFDTENSTGYPLGRADKISVTARTEAARGFCETIKSNGYKVSIYASRDWFYHNLNMVALASYDVWLAHYTEDQNKKSNYTGRYQMWQYTSRGTLPGISGDVDKNVSYYNYS